MLKISKYAEIDVTSAVVLKCGFEITYLDYWLIAVGNLFYSFYSFILLIE